MITESMILQEELLTMFLPKTTLNVGDVIIIVNGSDERFLVEAIKGDDVILKELK